MHRGRLLFCAPRWANTVPSVKTAEALLRDVLHSCSSGDTNCLSCSSLVTCVSVMEWRRQVALENATLRPSECLLSTDTAQFLTALCEVRGDCCALSDRLWATATRNISDAQRVVAGVRELLTGLEIFLLTSQENANSVPGGLWRLELNLLEIIVRHEGAVIGDVTEACGVLQRMHHTLMRPGEANEMSAAERRKWNRRIRQLTTVMYFRLYDCSADEVDMFKRTLRCLYGVGNDSSASFGYMNKIRYSVGVLLPYFLRNTGALKDALVNLKGRSTKSENHRVNRPQKSNPQKGKQESDTANKITLAFALLGCVWYMFSMASQPLTCTTQSRRQVDA